jgi:hypothetical protein
VRRYLVVANQTLGTHELYKVVDDCLTLGPCTFYVVVPATPPAEHLTWTEGEARAIASNHLERALTLFGELGAEAEGEVGDANPLLAIWDALQVRQFDHIILSTLPAGVSRWLKMDLPNRVRASFNLPVTHIVAEPSRHGRS